MNLITAVLPGGTIALAMSAVMGLVTIATARSLMREEAAAVTERSLG